MQCNTMHDFPKYKVYITTCFKSQYTYSTRISSSSHYSTRFVCFQLSIQPFSHSLAIISQGLHYETSVQVFLGKLFLTCFVFSQHKAPMNVKPAQKLPSLVSNLHIGQVEPRIYISCVQRNSR